MFCRNGARAPQVGTPRALLSTAGAAKPPFSVCRSSESETDDGRGIMAARY